MSEIKDIRYTEWQEEPGTCEACRSCMRRGTTSLGRLMKRRVIGRDNDIHNEYKVICRVCGASTVVHRRELVTRKEWEGKQDPRNDDLPKKRSV